MATYNSATYDAQALAAGNAAKFIDTAELVSGKLAFFQATFTSPAGGLLSTDLVNLGTIPSGFAVVPALSSVSIDGTGGAGLLSIGNAADAVAYSATATVAAAGNVGFGNKPVAAVNSARTDVLLKSSVTVTAARVLTVSIALVSSN
jgi:hypothetical protein|tara:strand:+ start:348 stop:788 length:441 start_codon:yes stop_codon:yes gene_type:complete